MGGCKIIEEYLENNGKPRTMGKSEGVASAIHAEREFVNDKRYGTAYMRFKGQLALYSTCINQHTYARVCHTCALHS